MADFKQLAQLLGDLDEEGVLGFINQLVADGASRDEGLSAVSACQEGMNIVGDLFEQGEYFIGDLIFAGEILTGAVNGLKPILAGDMGKKIGTIVLGTVHGDLHDIGKNIFKNMVEIAGFEVYDLGIDVPESEFIKKINEVDANIVGLSGVLTLALDSMKDTIDAITEAGLRSKVKIIIGGNCVSPEAGEFMGADAATKNAAEGVRICSEWVK